MKVTVSFEADSEKEYRELFSKLTSLFDGNEKTSNTQKKIEPPVKSVTKAKEQDQAAVAEQNQEKPKSSSAISEEEIRSLVVAKAKTNKEEIRGELSRLGAKNVSSLDSAHYEEFKNFLESL